MPVALKTINKDKTKKLKQGLIQLQNAIYTIQEYETNGVDSQVAEHTLLELNHLWSDNFENNTSTFEALIGDEMNTIKELFDDLSDSLKKLIKPVDAFELSSLENEINHFISSLLSAKEQNITELQIQRLRQITSRLVVAGMSNNPEISYKTLQLNKKLNLLSKLF
jgi:hypothetical protein